MHWNSVCSALSCTAARSSFAWSEQGRSTGRPTPLKLEAEQLQKLAQLGYEPAEEAQGSPPSDLGFLDQVMSPFRSEPHTLIGLVVLGAYVLFTGWAGVLLRRGWSLLAAFAMHALGLQRVSVRL